MTYKEYLEMGYEDFSMKLNSIPENEPLYKIFKSRSIELGAIKDKEERKYWRELKRINEIPDIYKSIDEIYDELKKEVGGNKWKHN